VCANVCVCVRACVRFSVFLCFHIIHSGNGCFALPSGTYFMCACVRVGVCACARVSLYIIVCV